MPTLQHVAQWLQNAKSTAVLTGAGISTESGIPDFRSPSGIWSKFRPVQFQEYLASPEARFESWRQKSLTHKEFFQAQPNVGHRVLAKWEEERRIAAVITQNIDGLHQLAGNKIVFELHGTAREVACLDCGARFPADEMVQRFIQENKVPDCPNCDGMLKHATISFGQALPADVLRHSIKLAESADLFFVIGSSLVVEPAALLPRIAKQSNARLVILNRDETPIDSLADARIHEPIGQTLAAIDQLCAAKSPRGLHPPGS